MRRATHWLFALCSAASLVLCLGACVLWARGQPGTDGGRDGFEIAGSGPDGIADNPDDIRTGFVSQANPKRR